MAWRNMTGSTTAHVFTETFTFGTPAQARTRPLWVRASIRPDASNAGRMTGTAPLALLSGVSADARIPNTEGGHLVGLSIGGPDCSDNLVPMFGLTNRDTYRTVERDINTRAKFGGSPAVLIKIDYPPVGTGVDQDPRLPTGFTVWYVANVPDLAQLAENPSGAPIHRVANSGGNPVRFDVQGADIERRRFLVELRTRTLDEKWSIELLGGAAVAWNARGYLPPVGKRPYGFVDRLVYSPDYASYAALMLPRWDACDIAPGREFAEGQRLNLVYASCYTQSSEKKGECWSDDATDPVQSVLTPMGTDDGIEIDHIHPKASMGPNIYSNAQVISSRHNRSKGRS